MATKTLNTRIQNKIDSEANWNNNPDFIPLKGEMIVYSKDANNKAARVKFGDGVTKLSDLKFSGVSNIPLTPITKPTVRGSLTYNKSSQTPTWLNYDSSKMTLSGTTSATNAGTYTATFTPLTGYCWEDDESTDAINVTWTINKVTPQIILSSSTVAVYMNCDLHVKVTMLPEYANGNIHASYSGTDSLHVTMGSDDDGNYGVLIVDDEGSVTDDTRGTITVTFSPPDHGDDSTNYNRSTATINVVAGSVLDGMSWTAIKEGLVVGSKEDFANYASIGDTKTITLTPNQRIRLPQGEETVKVFLADIYEDSKSYSIGALFAGFKDSEGRDIAITPDPEIRVKKWIPGGISFLTMVSDSLSLPGVDTIEESLKVGVGTHKLKYSYTKNDSTVINDTAIEIRYGNNGYGFFASNGDALATYSNQFGYQGSLKVQQFTITESQYISLELLRAFGGCMSTLSISPAVVDGVEQIEYVKFNKTLGGGAFPTIKTYNIFGDPVQYTSGPACLIYGTSSSGIMYPNGNSGNPWTRYAPYDRYFTINKFSEMPPASTLFYWLENTTRISRTNLTKYLEGDAGEDALQLDRVADLITMIQTNGDGSSLELSITGAAYNGDMSDSVSFSKIVFEWNTSYIYMKIYDSQNDTYYDVFRMDSGGAYESGDGYEVLGPMYLVNEADIALCNIILDNLFTQGEGITNITGSWIWNESVASNLSSLPTDTMISIEFRAGDMIQEDELPQLQYCINPTNPGTLTYDGFNPVTVVTGDGVFHPEYAAMHFGDEPQSVPKYFYDFLVANADYMSYGFGSSLMDDSKYLAGAGPIVARLWQSPMTRVLGYTVEDHGYGTYQTATNTLYEALPTEFKEVLSNIYEEDPAVSGSPSILCKYALPYLNEIGISDTDGATGKRSYITSNRLGYAVEGTDPITYYHNANTTVKYDIWNKTAPVLQHSASMGEESVGESRYSLINTSNKTYVSIDNVEELRKPQFVSAGLAPIFLIGGATDQGTCNHEYSWETIYDTTCTTDGYEVYRCSICGYEAESNYIPATGHSYGVDNVCTSCGESHDCYDDNGDGYCDECDNPY